MYASMVADDADARLAALVAGESAYRRYGTRSGGYSAAGAATTTAAGGTTGYGGHVGISGRPGSAAAPARREVWEARSRQPAFTNRTPPLDVPTARYDQAMAYNPSTGKTYIFGGYDSTSGQALNDLWEWDGKTWAQVAADVQPLPDSDAGLAYDPVRKSLILLRWEADYQRHDHLR
jgi:hypothetical protein